MSYAGDPLADFATMAFLDRFSYKNPKQQRRAGAGAEGEEEDEEAAHNLGAGALAKRVRACVESRGEVDRVLVCALVRWFANPTRHTQQPPPPTTKNRSRRRRRRWRGRRPW